MSDSLVRSVLNDNFFAFFPSVDVKRLHQVMMEIFEYCRKETDQASYRASVGDACCAKFTGQ